MLQITYECLEKVVLWLKYFESHAYRIYGASANAVPKASADLIHRIQKGEIAVPFTARGIYQGHHWAGLSDADAVEEVLEYLTEKNYLIDTPIKTKGRPTKKYWAHPKIFEQCHE